MKCRELLDNIWQFEFVKLTSWNDDSFLVWEILRHGGRRVSLDEIIARDVGSLREWFLELGFKGPLLAEVIPIAFVCWLQRLVGIVERRIEKWLIIWKQLLLKKKDLRFLLQPSEKNRAVFQIQISVAKKFLVTEGPKQQQILFWLDVLPNYPHGNNVKSFSRLCLADRWIESGL